VVVTSGFIQQTQSAQNTDAGVHERGTLSTTKPQPDAGSPKQQKQCITLSLINHKNL